MSRRPLLLAAALLTISLIFSPRAVASALPSGATASAATPPASEPTPAPELLATARTTAAATHRNILLLFSASWCGPCHRLQHFLADPAIRPVMDRNFVTLVLDDSERAEDTLHHNNPGADQLRVSFHGTNAGVPFLVMLRSTGQPIVSSLRPLYGPLTPPTNIGYPETAVEIDWFLEMLRRAAPSLTPAERSTVQRWLQQHAGH